MEDTEFEDIKNYLSLQTKEVQANANIVDPSMMGVLWSMHIDKNTPPVFTPRMPKSAMASENDSCPRVTVACTLLGCYIGYFRGEEDVANGSPRNEGESDHFLGGYNISKLRFNQALKPKPKLVRDADRSEELWLVPYNDQNTEYKPIIIGKMFVSALSYLPVSGEYPNISITLYVQNTDTDGMWLDRKIKLDVGYYKVHVTWPSLFERSIYNEKTEVETISKDEFENRKRAVANFLNRHTDILKNTPKYLSW